MPSTKPDNMAPKICRLYSPLGSRKIPPIMNWKIRFRAAGIHLCISLAIAALAATLVFALWYPYPYRDISGGRELFGMLVGIDVRTIRPVADSHLRSCTWTSKA